MRLGVSDYLLKPFQDGELEGAIQRLLHLHPENSASAKDLEDELIPLKKKQEIQSHRINLKNKISGNILAFYNNHKKNNMNNDNKYLLYGEEQPKRKTIRKKKGVKVKKVGKRMKAVRYFKKVGLGFKTPSDAIQGNYIDKKCPFTGNVSIRGRIIKGMVLSTKMKIISSNNNSIFHFS